jgi:hypothetical protein
MMRRPARFTVAASRTLAISIVCTGCVTHNAPYDGFDAANPQSAYSGPEGDPNAPPPVSKYAQRNNPPVHPSPGRYGQNQVENSTTSPGKSVTDAETLKKLMAELQSLGAVDPETQSRLLADFEQTDPALWPMLMQTFRAGMAYRQGRTAGADASQIADTGPKDRSSPIVLTSAAAEVSDTPETRPVAPQSPSKPTPFAATPQAADARLANIPTPITQPALPQPPLPQPYDSDPAAQLPLSTLQFSLPGQAGGASSLPTQQLLAAALAEAQRKAAESQTVSPPAVPPAAIDDPFAAPAPSPHAATSGGTSIASTGPSSQADCATCTDPNCKHAHGSRSPVRRAADAPASGNSVSGTWQDRLNEAIAKLEPLTREPPKDAAEVSRHAWLRMLYLTAGRRDDALKPIAGISAAEQDYWSEQLYALATTLDVERTPDAAQRSAEARRHLAKAENRLAETGLLAVRNLAFCTEVSSYGVYQKFGESTFKANQPLILYAEVDNFKSEETSKGFHTALRSSYQIIDAQGRRVAENDLALTEEFCRNRRRDYFIRYFLSVPERIYDGKYTLQLTIVDTLSQKIGQASIDFTVGEPK